jgi:hypothetical protein
MNGYGVYYGNQSLQIPFVQRINDPSLFPHDPFADTLNYYVSALWFLVAWISRIIPLKATLLILFLCGKLLSFHAAAQVARAFAPGSHLAIIGSMALFSQLFDSILGKGTLVSKYFEQTSVGVVFILLAIAAFYRSQPIWWAIWSACAFNINSMYATYAFTYFGAAFFLDKDYRNAWKKWFLAFGLSVILFSPTLVWTLTAFGKDVSDHHLWYIVSESFLPYHLFPHTWDKRLFVKFGILIGLVFAVLYHYRHTYKTLFKHSQIWAGMAVLWLLYAFVAAYITKSPSMLVMHPARATDMWYCFAALALISVFGQQVETAQSSQQSLISAAGLIASLLIWEPFGGAIGTSKLADTYTIAVVTIILVIAYKPISEWLFAQHRARQLAILLLVWLTLTSLTGFSNRIRNEGGLQAALVQQPSPAIQQVAAWAKQNTPRDAVLLGNPGEWDAVEYLRPLAERSLFVSYKDGSAILWDRSYVTEWVERIQAFGLDITKDKLNFDTFRWKFKQAYDKLSDADITRLQARYKLDYWLVPKDHPSQLAIAFQNDKYKLLRLGNS